MLKPYSVADYVLDVGYADSGEYREEVGIIPRQQ
jgi:hypothetical protein